VFPESFTQTAAAAIWDISSREADETLISLVRHNLLDYRTTTYSYLQHDLVRLHAQELLLGQMKRTDLVVAHYANYVLEQAKAANKLYADNESTMADGLMRFSTLWPDLWRAWNRMNGSDLGWPFPEDTQRWLCDFPLLVWAVLSVTRSLDEKLKILSRALEAAVALEDLNAEATHLGNLGRIHMALEDAENALVRHERQLEIAYTLRDRHHEADALMNIGQACGALGDVKRAQESWRQAIALFDVIGDERAATVRTWLETLDDKIIS
jgi:tetratricopeptide (TPR) repeat protein